MNRSSFKIVWILFFAFSSFCSFSQDDLVVFGIIRDKDNQSKLEGVQCQVQQDNGTYDAVATNKNGKYEFDMPLGYVYKFKFSMNNYVHKIILVDTKNMYSEDHKGGFEMNMDITLFKMVDGFDTSIMDEPFGKAKFDNIKNDLVFDFAYTEKQNFKVEDELDRLEDAEKNKEKNQKEFDQLMAKGSDKMLEDKYSEAISKFKAALKIFPTDQTAKDKLAEAEQALADSKKDKEKDSKYQKFLTEGNKEFKNENWAEAKMNYEKALEVKPGEQIPKDKIKEIEKIITSMLQRGDFNELVDAGDRLFEDEEYEKAIEKYSSALEIFSNESHPRDQIQKAQTIINDLANAEKEAEAKEKEYNDLIKFAQKNFKAGEYEAARDKYVSAGKIKPEETMPPKKIEEIDKLLAELAEEKAKEDQENAENAEKDKIEAEYQAFIDKANDFFKDKEFEKAKVEYENALGVKANDVFAERKIETINDILSELAEKEKEDEAQNEAQAEQDRIDKEYEAYKAEADNLFDAEKYEEAKEKYNLALGVKSGEKYPKSRIQRIDEILAQMETEAEDDALALELAKKSRKKRMLD